MKKEIIIRIVFTVFLFNYFNVFSQTNIPSGNVSGLWTITGSPYLIQGSIMIPNDSTLTIEPGVTVNFQGTYKLYIQGRIIAIGNPTDTIIFISANTTNGWRGLRFDNTPTNNDTSKLFYCKFQYGKAIGTSPDDKGGAIYFDNFSKAIISNSHISNCMSSTIGGGICCNNNSNPKIHNCIILNNSSYTGGGIGCFYSNPIISNNYISNNIGNYGGGIYCGHSTIISNNIICNNNAPNKGGGIFCGSNSLPSITNNSIRNNSSNDGGAIYCDNYCGATISKNFISNNNATNNGGAVLCYNGSNPTFTNNTITNNTSNNFGGGIYCEYNNNPNILNNTISNNNALKGGALYCNTSSNPTFRNTVLWGNTASTNGAQVFLNTEDCDPNFYFCDIQGGNSAFELNGNFYLGIYQNNIVTDPMFVSPSLGSGINYDGVNANWSLQSNSPCINTGNPSGTYPSTDIVGNPRIIDGTIDIGAYEFQGGSSIEAISQDLFSVFPNPAYDNIEITGLENGKIEIINTQGQIIKTIIELNKKTIVDLSKCATGLYLIKATFDNRIAVKTIIKQ